MKAVIDRFEGGFAVLEFEDGRIENIPCHRVPEAAHEGDILIIDGESFVISKAGTKLRREKIIQLEDELWK